MDLIFSNGTKELVFKEKDGMGRIVFIYEDPKADERIKFAAAMGNIYRGKDVDQVSFEEITKLQFDFGKKILSSFRVEGIPSDISSDPESPQFRSDWKDLLSDRAFDLVIALCQNVFGMGGYLPEKNS